MTHVLHKKTHNLHKIGIYICNFEHLRTRHIKLGYIIMNIYIKSHDIIDS